MIKRTLSAPYHVGINSTCSGAWPVMRDVLREVLRTSQNATLRDLAMQALDATNPPAELPQENPEAQ